MAAGKGVDEGGAVALSQHVQHAGLVEVDQIHHVLHLVQVGGVRLPGEDGEHTSSNSTYMYIQISFWLETVSYMYSKAFCLYTPVTPHWKVL